MVLTVPFTSLGMLKKAEKLGEEKARVTQDGEIGMLQSVLEFSSNDN